MCFFYRILTELMYLKCIYMQWGHRRMHFILINFQLIQFPSAKGTQSGQSKRILTYMYSLVTANGHSANYVQRGIYIYKTIAIDISNAQDRKRVQLKS